MEPTIAAWLATILCAAATDVVRAGRAQPADAGDDRLLRRDLQHAAIQVVGRGHAAARRVDVQHQRARDVVVLRDGGEYLLISGRLNLSADCAEEFYDGDSRFRILRVGSEYKQGLRSVQVGLGVVLSL